MVQEDKLFKTPEERKAEEKIRENAEKKESEADKKEAGEEKQETDAKTTDKQVKKEAEKKIEGKTVEKSAKKQESEKKEEKKREIVLERVYSIPLAKAYSKPEKQRANTAISLLNAFLKKHLKAVKLKISPDVVNAIQKRGARKPLKKIRVKATKDKEGIVLAEKN